MTDHHDTGDLDMPPDDDADPMAPGRSVNDYSDEDAVEPNEPA
jgi:hypothetical protein